MPTKNALELTYAELRDDYKEGDILVDEHHDGVRYLVMRGLGALCAYVGVPVRHPLAGLGADELPLNCHGGLTFAGKGAGDPYRPGRYYWYGWDYGHFQDALFFSSRVKGIKWTVKKVVPEVESVVYDFKKLMNLAEIIKEKISNG